MPDVPVIAIESAEDPRLEPFRDLRNRNLTRVSRRFVAEGWNVVERLLRSGFETEIVLCSPKYVEQVQQVWQGPGVIYLLDHDKFPVSTEHEFAVLDLNFSDAGMRGCKTQTCTGEQIHHRVG